MEQAAILGVLRHLLTTFGGGLAATVGFSASEWETLIGAGLVALGTVWSVMSKRATK